MWLEEGGGVWLGLGVKKVPWCEEGRLRLLKWQRVAINLFIS